jgi:hypothetical protein
MGRDRRSILAGYRVLLVATAIQGLTPDHGSLASPWLLRLVTSGWPGGRAADGGPAPMPTPISSGDHDGVPGEVCSAVAAKSSLRARLDTGERLCIQLIPIGLIERPSRTVPRRPYPTGEIWRGSDGLIPALCRFVC